MLNRNWTGRIYRQPEGEEAAGGGEGAAATWRDSLPEDLRAAPSLATIKDVAALAKSYTEQQQFIGSSIRIPSDNAGEADRKAFYDKLATKVPGLIPRPDINDPIAKETFYKMLGRPDKPEEYELPENVPNDELAGLFRTVAHQQGLNRDQLKAVLGVFPAIAEHATKATEKANFERTEAVKKEWGLATEKNTAIAASVAEKTGAPKELIEAVAKGQAGIGTLKWLHSLAASFGGEGKHFAGVSGQPAPMTPNEAAARIVEIRNNKQHPVWNKRDPLHVQAVQEWVKLHASAKPVAAR